MIRIFSLALFPTEAARKLDNCILYATRCCSSLAWPDSARRIIPAVRIQLAEIIISKQRLQPASPFHLRVLTPAPDPPHLQGLEYYISNYPTEGTKVLGFLDYQLLLLFQLDHIYSAWYFYASIVLLGASLMACTYTTQLPNVKVRSHPMPVAWFWQQGFGWYIMQACRFSNRIV